MRLAQRFPQFVSYSTKNDAQVRAIVAIKGRTFDHAFLDWRRVHIGDSFEHEIFAAIDGCMEFHLCWSRDAAASHWVQQEVEHALKRWERDGRVSGFLFVYRLDDLQVPSRITDHVRVVQVVDLFGSERTEGAAVAPRGGADSTRRTAEHFRDDFGRRAQVLCILILLAVAGGLATLASSFRDLGSGVASLAANGTEVVELLSAEASLGIDIRMSDLKKVVLATDCVDGLCHPTHSMSERVAAFNELVKLEWTLAERPGKYGYHSFDLEAARLDGGVGLTRRLAGVVDVCPVPTASSDCPESVIQRRIVTNLRGSHLRGADMEGAALWMVDLRAADLRGAVLRGADLSMAKLVGADLTGAMLGGAKLDGADLRGARLDHADLQGVNMRGADLAGASLAGARMASAPEEAGINPAHLEGCFYDEATVWPAGKSGTSFGCHEGAFHRFNETGELVRINGEALPVRNRVDGRSREATPEELGRLFHIENTAEVHIDGVRLVPPEGTGAVAPQGVREVISGNGGGSLEVSGLTIEQSSPTRGAIPVDEGAPR